MKRWIGLLALAPVLVAAHAPTTANLTGEWRSAAPEPMGAFHAVRDFVFTPGQWAMVFRAYADAEARKPLFTLRIDGPYVVGGASTQVSGASEVTFQYAHRYVTADSADGVAMFAKMGCTLRVGDETDVSLQGCGFVPSMLQAGVEYDLLKLEGDKLYFGDRSGDLSKARPQKLGAQPVTKR